MSSLLAEKLDQLVGRWHALQDELSKGAINQATYAKLSKEFSDLNPVVATIEGLRKAEKERADLKLILSDASADREMVALAEEELAALTAEGEITLAAEAFAGLQRGVVIVESIAPNEDFESGEGINTLTSAFQPAPYGGAVFHDNHVWIRAA